MGLLLLILEIVIAVFLAIRLGREAHDKGFSNILFIILALGLWFITRIIGNVIGFLLMQDGLVSSLVGWLFAIVGYCVFYYLISRIKDKEMFNEHEADWKKRNSPSSSTGTETTGEK